MNKVKRAFLYVLISLFISDKRYGIIPFINKKERVEKTTLCLGIGEYIEKGKINQHDEVSLR